LTGSDIKVTIWIQTIDYNYNIISPIQSLLDAYISNLIFVFRTILMLTKNQLIEILPKIIC